MEARRFAAGAFEGPLDLLWALIRENRVSVFDIPINEITEQFLSWLDHAESVELGDLSDFYRMAARLIHIKSREMLPVRDSEGDDVGDDDPRGELVDSLIEHQRFRMLSALMERTEDDSAWSFERRRIRRAVPEPDPSEGWEKVDAGALLSEMQRLFRGMMASWSDARILDMYEEISVGEKLTLMEELFDRRGECRFTDLVVREGNGLDVVCAFMAVLEAVKFKMAVVWQNRMFGDIRICRCAA